jgi:hypothetical protein
MLIVGVGKLQLTTSSTSLAPAAVPQQWWWRRSSSVTPHSGKLLGSLLPLLRALLYHCHGVDALCPAIKLMNFKKVVLLFWYWNVLVVV